MTGGQKPLVKIQRAQLVSFKRAPTLKKEFCHFYFSKIVLRKIQFLLSLAFSI